ncbi:MAG: GNAT family N-acetyltransferase [Clostridia bacterium]|nr:GNAT family N-acetyltransferase [Clostridia bacterium]
MFSLNIQNDAIFFKDIKLEHLPYILQWYNKVDDFKFATGIDTPMTLEMLTKKYAEVAICSNEFFVGIFDRCESKMIGILKGRLHYKEKDAVWISSLAIDSQYQRRGFGSSALSLLLSYLKQKNMVKSVYLAVIEENIQGKSFWAKHNFQVLRKIEKHIKLHDRQQNAIIMYRHI